MKTQAKDIKGIDPECVGIVDLLNSLPEIETFDSCCGHGKEPFRVFFTCRSWSSLGILARCVDRNYSTGTFHIKSENGDDCPCFNFMLESKSPMSPDEIKMETEGLTRNIRYWSGPEFKDYFKVDNPCSYP